MIAESTNIVMSSSSLDLSYTKVVKFIECIKVCLSLPFVFFWILIKLNFGSELGYEK